MTTRRAFLGGIATCATSLLLPDVSWAFGRRRCGAGHCVRCRSRRCVCRWRNQQEIACVSTYLGTVGGENYYKCWCCKKNDYCNISEGADQNGGVTRPTCETCDCVDAMFSPPECVIYYIAYGFHGGSTAPADCKRLDYEHYDDDKGLNRRMGKDCHFMKDGQNGASNETLIQYRQQDTDPWTYAKLFDVPQGTGLCQMLIGVQTEDLTSATTYKLRGSHGKHHRVSKTDTGADIYHVLVAN